jgi:hypothetical protein
MRANQRVSALWCSQLRWFDHLLGPSAQFTVARDARGSDASHKTTRHLGNVGL